MPHTSPAFNLGWTPRSGLRTPTPIPVPATTNVIGLDPVTGERTEVPLASLLGPEPAQAAIPISAVAQTAMRAGGDMAQQQEQLGLFGSAMSKMFNSPLIGTAVDRLIELSMRPEALSPRFGDTFISPLARAAAGQQMERRAAATSEQGFMRDLALAQAKRPAQQLTNETSQLLDRITANREGLRVLDNMKALAATGGVGGGANVGLSAVKTFFRAFNIDVKETDTEEYEKNVAQYMVTLQEQRAFGTEASKQDYLLAKRILSNPGIFSSPSELAAQLQPLVEKLTRSNQQLIERANAFGLGALVSDNPPVFVATQIPTQR